MTCGCENKACEAGHTPAERCQREATVACKYIGGLCADCAEYMPNEFLLKGPVR